jgi:DNA-nicking Smr family endonuclease
LQKIISKAKKNEPLILQNIFDKDSFGNEKSKSEIDALYLKKKDEIKDLQFGVNQYFLKTSTISKIKNGLMHIDQIIDLHHMKLHEAYLFLISSLENAYKNEKRMILLITGKGYGNGFFKSETNFDETDFSDKTIIRNNILDWINNSNFLIGITLYINFAQEKHGGHGAFYLYLKF